jgi:hypothetical protein
MKANRKIQAEFTHQEWDTVLAALRFWQKVSDDKYLVPIGGDEYGEITAIRTRVFEDSEDIAFAHGTALSKKAIDKLCERINYPKPRERKVAK